MSGHGHGMPPLGVSGVPASVQVEDESTPLLVPSPAPRRLRRCGFWTGGVVFLLIMLALFVLVVLPALQAYNPDIQPTKRLPPGTPQLNVTVANVTDIQLRWSQPSSGTAAILGYRAFVHSHNHTDVAYEGPERYFLFRAALGNTWYCFSVAAFSSVGQSNHSVESCFVTPPAVPPDPPSCACATKASASSIDIAWRPPDQSGGAVIDNYVVQGMPIHIIPPPTSSPLALGQQFQQICATSNASIQCSAAGLDPATTYLVRVAANSSAVGLGNWSEETVLHTDESDPTVPSAPSNLTAEAIDSSSMTLTWPYDPRIRTLSDGGSQLIRFEVEMAKADNTTAPGSFTPVFSGICSNYVKVSSLVAETTYCFRIRACNSLGCGTWLGGNNTLELLQPDSLCFTTYNGSSPSAPALRPHPIATSPTSLQVAWTRPNDGGLPISHYILERDDWWVDGPLSPIFHGLAQNYTADTHLMPAVVYHFRVRAVNQAGESPWSKTLGYRTDDNGHCGNEADVQVYKKTKHTMKPDIQKCIISCIASGPSCVVSCIHNKVGLSQSCSKCWAEEGACTLKKCATQCINPSSKACAQCSEDKCFPDCVKCSGIPRYFFPP